MKRHYFIYFSLGVAAILFLQAINIFNLYNNFLVIEQQKVEDATYEAIGLELHHRKVKFNTPDSNVQYMQAITDNADAYDLKYYPKELKDAVLKHLATIPKPIRKEYSIPKLMDEGVIRSAGDFDLQNSQDILIKQGISLNVKTLDSLFDIRIGQGYSNRVILRNSADSILNATAPIKYNYTSKPVQIGLQGLQRVIVEVNIAPSKFIQNSILILILSLIMVMVPLLSLIYFITNIRRRDEELKRREISINGIIHDLKSPIVKIGAMLDLFEILETNSINRNMIITNQNSIMLLSSKIERLLSTTKDHIEIYKEKVNKRDIEQRATILIEDLQRYYSHKKIELNLYCDIAESINIDTMCFDSFITNLVDNSLKYSNDSVKVDVSVKQYGDKLTITVWDNGIGIAEKEKKQIFKYLYRVDHSNGKGNGIGLTYIRALSQAHGGNTTLKASELNKFSEFNVIINIG